MIVLDLLLTRTGNPWRLARSSIVLDGESPPFLSLCQRDNWFTVPFIEFSRLTTNGVVGGNFIRNAESSRFSKSYSADAAIGGSLVDESEEKDDLKSRIFRLRLPKRSVTTVLEKWAGEGNQITVNELREISRELRRTRRYKHALEVLPSINFLLTGFEIHWNRLLIDSRLLKRSMDLTWE